MTPPDTDDHLRIILEHINAMGNINSNSLIIMEILMTMQPKIVPSSEMRMEPEVSSEMRTIEISEMDQKHSHEVYQSCI